MTEPTTAAGRALFAQFRSHRARTVKDYPVHWLGADDILAIESEARAAALADVRAILAKHDSGGGIARWGGDALLHDLYALTEAKP